MLAATVSTGLLGVLSAIGAWLINNLSTAFVIALVGYLVYLERTYGPRFIGWAIAVANQALHLHLTQVEQQATAGLVERTVLAAQQSITLPADRRASVLQAVAQIFPAASEAHVDSLINATIATARLQHDGAWDKLAPTASAEATAAPALDIEAVKKDAFAAGQQALLALIQAASAEAAAPAPVAVPTATPTPAPEALHIVDPASGETVGVVTPAPVG